MSDLSDDWMNPQPSPYISREPENKTVYAIMRAKREPCFGHPGSIIRWAEWQSFDTAAERDEEIVRLQKEHPCWRLKSRDYNPWLDWMGLSDALPTPTESGVKS